MKRFVLAAGICLATGSATASECPAIDNDLDRLACYDRESGRTPIALVTTPDPVKKNWVTRVEKSEFEDTTDVFLTAFSTNDITCRNTPEPVRLVLRCMENTTSLLLITESCHLASRIGGYGDVKFRIDRTPTTTRSLEASTDHRTLGLWSGRSSIPVIKELLSAEKLLVRFTPYSQTPVTARFNVAGLEDAITPLREACNW